MNLHEWQKSTYCQSGDACIHAAAGASGTLLLTESADPTHAILRATPAAFSALLQALREE